jgi:hypothetical protein
MDEWPSSHPSDNEELRAFNYSLFEIRKHYRDIFHEEEYAPMDLSDDAPKPEKVFKI